MKPTDLEARVRAIAWPAPSPDLRARVLAAAPFIEPSITWSDRLWFSRTSRLSVAAAMLGLLTLDQFSGTRETAFVPGPQAVVEAQAIEDTSRQLGLPADAAAVLARRVLAESRSRMTVRRIGPTADWLTEGGDSR